ncbi:ZP domain-containing protein [Nematolebias whitei]|uniref:ZP domain-containing protein n=1 Tax=Nematolebias whitei TaxID=451745 RepID=UPI00189B422F|nr:ZP domain-containing protein [Nematolebias whitei]
MTLYRDESYTSSYSDLVELGIEDTLFFQVALQTNSSFASDVLLQVESCWATESPNPGDAIQATFLQEGCPLDDTFRWLSVNGEAQRSRFSVQMFHMPLGLPLYFHCLTNICGHDEVCTKNCSSQRRLKRLVSQMDGKEKQAAVVSAGPLTVSTRVKSIHPDSFEAVLKYYNQLRLE